MRKFDNIKKIKSSALTNAEIKYELFSLVSNEAENYCRLKQRIRKITVHERTWIVEQVTN